MAASVNNFWFLPSYSLNSVCNVRPRVLVRSSGGGDSAVLSSNLARVNGAASVGESDNGVGSLAGVKNGWLGSNIKEEDKRDGDVTVPEKLEPLWDDGYGTQTVKDYMDLAKDIIKPDGGPPRWFCPVSCGKPLPDSPVLLFLPGMDGLGLGIILHQKALGKVFEVRCLHIPVHDRTPFAAGDPVKMATVNIENSLPPAVVLEQLSNNLVALLLRVSGLADIIPKSTLLWKLKLLKLAANYANSRLHAVTAEVLVIASGKDNMIPSRDEARRLSNALQNCRICYFKDNGHTILLEDGFNLLTVIKGTTKYRRSSKHDFVKDFVPPSMSELDSACEGNAWYRFATSPVMLSTMEDGNIVRGLSGIPNEGPILLVGYHMLLGLELVPLVVEFLREKNVLPRGLAHPEVFAKTSQSQSHEYSYPEFMTVFGALPVTSTNLYKLFSTKSHVLLYPGGAREALHRKGEEYKLFWPDRPEFVRMAVRFGATIVPFGVVGEDDIAELVFDYEDVMRIPILNDFIRSSNEEVIKVRPDTDGEVANQDFHLPGLLPKIPGRFYYLFGKPVRTKGREKMLEDRESTKALYLDIKSEVERSMAYLLKKREEDPYRGIVDRTIYSAFSSPPLEQVPTFDP